MLAPTGRDLRNTSKYDHYHAWESDLKLTTPSSAFDFPLDLPFMPDDANWRLDLNDRQTQQQPTPPAPSCIQGLQSAPGVHKQAMGYVKHHFLPGLLARMHGPMWASAMLDLKHRHRKFQQKGLTIQDYSPRPANAAGMKFPLWALSVGSVQPSE